MQSRITHHNNNNNNNNNNNINNNNNNNNMVLSHPHLPNALLQEGSFQIRRTLKFVMYENFTIICNILG